MCLEAFVAGVDNLVLGDGIEDSFRGIWNIYVCIYPVGASKLFDLTILFSPYVKSKGQ